MRALALLGILLAALTFVVAQQLPPAATFANRDYPTYLAQLDKELDGKTPPTFTQIARVAIALDKTQGWDTAVGKRARTLAGNTPETGRWFDGLRLLLAGDTNGITLLFGSQPYPPYGEFTGMQTILRDHGYDQGATTIGSIIAASSRVAAITGNVAFAYQDPKVIKDGVIAWAGIPDEQRGPINAMMSERLKAINHARVRSPVSPKI